MQTKKINKFPTLSKLIQADDDDDDDIHNDRNHHHHGHKINQICGFHFFFVHLYFTDDGIGKKFLKIHIINITMIYVYEE